MQRHYEIVLLIHPSRSEQVPAMLARYREMVFGGEPPGQVHRVEDWGRRRLAYMIDEVHKAHYVMMNVECDLATLRELERNFKFNDSVVRSLVIRRNRAITEESALAKAKAAEDQAEAEREAAQAARDAQAAADEQGDAEGDDAEGDAPKAAKKKASKAKAAKDDDAPEAESSAEAEAPADADANPADAESESEPETETQPEPA